MDSDDYNTRVASEDYSDLGALDDLQNAHTQEQEGPEILGSTQAGRTSADQASFGTVRTGASVSG
tara:strand:+ start:688 stop:882 length:195 start_codon:yes stop_codon:yes gene_type:complete